MFDGHSIGDDPPADLGITALIDILHALCITVYAFSEWRMCSSPQCAVAEVLRLMKPDRESRCNATDKMAVHRTLLARASAAMSVTKILAPRALIVSSASFSALLGPVAMDMGLRPSLSLSALQAWMKAGGLNIDVAI
jgi:hypothetical protein